MTNSPKRTFHPQTINGVPLLGARREPDALAVLSHVVKLMVTGPSLTTLGAEYRKAIVERGPESPASDEELATLKLIDLTAAYQLAVRVLADERG